MALVPETTLFTTLPSPIGELLLLGARTGDRTALTGLYCDPPPEGQPPPHARRDDAAFTDAGRGAAAGPVEIDDRERDWWRVEADSGRLAALSAGRGVYDLCFDWSRGAWSLARVLD